MAPHLKLASRNDSLGFAARTRKNLAFIEHGLGVGADVHVVTQLMNSLLGLVVFPWERLFLEKIKTLQMAELIKEGWPGWEITAGSSETLGELMRLLRNGVAHGNIRFSSDAKDLQQVFVEVWNYRKRHTPPADWAARIRADKLREFCFRFVELVEQAIG